MTGPQGLPAPSFTQVFIDFDGTISQKDVLDELILRYARDDSWKSVEVQWQSGQIGSKECLSREFALLDVSRPELERFVDSAEIDPGTVELLTLFQKHHVPVTVLSDGIDFFIKRILRRHGVRSVQVRANSLVQRVGVWTLVCPWADSACSSAAAHCKCRSAEVLARPGRQSIYIGDGRSDLCPARMANTVFAKNALARSLTAEGVSFIPYSTLCDVEAVLRKAWAESKPSGMVPARMIQA